MNIFKHVHGDNCVVGRASAKHEKEEVEDITSSIWT